MTLALSSKKRVCLLTGAGGALGSAFCRRYASEYNIVAVYRTRKPTTISQSECVVDPLQPGKYLIENEGSIFLIQADLSDDRDISRVVEVALARFGRIDLLINAAAFSVWSPILASSHLVENMSSMFTMNVVVPLKIATEIARNFWQDRDRENLVRRCNVVNISSSAGIYIYHGMGQSGYSATKAALNNLSIHMSREFATFKVRVNVLAPNSFPGQITTESVCDGIVRLDQGDFNGRILLLDHDDETIL